MPSDFPVRLTNALLRAIDMDMMDQRLEAIQTVLLGRKDKDRKR